MNDCAKKFCYKSLDDVVEFISEDLRAVSYVSSAYRSVCVIPLHRKFQGFTWNLGEEDRWYEDLRVCF